LPHPFDELTDDALMVRVKDGDTAAFRHLVTRYERVLLSYAARFLGDQALAADLVQDVFLALWLERSRYEARGRFGSFMLKMTFNRCHMYVRRNRSQRRLLEVVGREPSPVVPSGVQLDDRILTAERMELVTAQLQDLAEIVRHVVLLRFTQDLSLAEIADITELPVGTIKSHLFRGLKRLQQGVMSTDEEGGHD
jgi:RNA polymerase sigma-70 factor (ECF subfamily)